MLGGNLLATLALAALAAGARAGVESRLVERIAFRRDAGDLVAADQICFIHVGKTGGATFRAALGLGNPGKDARNVSAIRAGRWNEFHTDEKRWLSLEWEEKCDFFVTWVRHPVSRLVSAFEYAKDLLAVGQPHNRRRRPMRLLQDKFGANLSTVAEHLYDPDEAPTEAFSAFSRLPHVYENTAFYFDYGPHTSGHIVTKNGSRLESPEFRRKLIFVGSQECFGEDLERFFRLFRASGHHEVVSAHATRSGAHADVERRLGARALGNLRRFAEPDYEVLRRMANYSMIQCDALLKSLY